MASEKHNVIHQLLEGYDIQAATKALLGGTIKQMTDAEIDGHFGYEKPKGIARDKHSFTYKKKHRTICYVSMEINVPQDSKPASEPK